MSDLKTVSEILTVFAQYGFKKTSMEDIARAAGLSRQSIYNRFGSKEAVFDWVVESFIADMLHRVTEILAAPKSTPRETLAQAYDTWIGSQVPLWSGTGHGAEILDLAIASVHRSSPDLEGDYAKSVSDFLLASGLADTSASAENKTFVLNLASKGLLVKARTAEEFSQGIRRVISTIL
ncbi:MAG: TetR/AcrR family transcriptional regulator of autoinduction and epiphytic fitness [Paracoccaceae bacterium]|jgi:TetR/AcrR family transcriptional regulator of autoinduction and epiphytic fitness